MAYSSRQLRLARYLVRRGEKRGESRNEILSALATGIVETRLRNLRGGDADSVNWRQERGHYGSVARRLKLRGSVDRYYNETSAVERKYRRPGDLAAAVQRPAAQYRGRYGQVMGDAESLYKRFAGGKRGSLGSSGGSAGTPGLALPGIPGSSGGVASVQRGSAAGAEALIESLQPPPQPPMGALPTPAFSAGPVMPRIGQAPVPSVPSFGAPVPPPDVQDAIKAAAALRREAPATQASDPGVPGLVIPGTEGTDGGGGAAVGGKSGKVSIRAGADRAGVKTKPGVISFARKVAGIAGVPMTLGTGTNHSRLTTSGRVSDHWGGNAGDFPAAGRRLTRMGQAALIAAGMDPKKARRTRGGLFNIGRYQIIFNTREGGNHWDHLHIGVR